MSKMFACRECAENCFIISEGGCTTPKHCPMPAQWGVEGACFKAVSDIVDRCHDLEGEVHYYAGLSLKQKGFYARDGKIYIVHDGKEIVSVEVGVNVIEHD